jgi:glycosyltransferase involved in cell wall biosynthesis
MAEAMNILLAAHGYPPELVGGAESHVAALASGLRQRGHRVAVVTGTLRWAHRLVTDETTVDGVAVTSIRRDDFHYERWWKTYHPGVSRLFGGFLRDGMGELGGRPDVVHVHHWHRLSLDLVRQAFLSGIPAVLTLHDFFATCPTINRILPDGAVCASPPGPDVCFGCLPREPGWDDEVAARALALRTDILANELRLAHRVLALSRSQRALLQAVLGEALRIEQSPFGPPLRLAPAGEPPPTPPLRIVSFGRISPQKGQHVLLEALRCMRHRGAVTLDLLGPFDGADYEARLRDAARELPNVRFLGPYRPQDLQSVAAHVAVFPSTCHETYGFVLDEAQMLGWPAIVSDVGAYAERLGGGGAAFPAGDAAALAALLDRCAEDPDLLARWRRARVAPPAFADVVDAMLEIYRAVVREGPRPGTDRFDADAVLVHALERSDKLERHLRAALERQRPGEQR